VYKQSDLTDGWATFDAALRQAAPADPSPGLRERCLPWGTTAVPVSLRILVVDDEPNIRRLIEHHLAGRGHQVVTAVNGNDALEKVRTLRPELLVLDVNMPGLDGFEVLAELKEDPATVEIPVIMLTALSTDDHIRHGWGIGADVYLTKPFNPQELVLLVDRLAAVLGTPDNPPPLRRWLK
jgi:two-component system alkaline phosphatase synthesis response regulator PhoP/two-component system response regulator VicR